MNQTEETSPASHPGRPVKVGWLFKQDAGSIIMFEPEELPEPPERMRSVEMSFEHAKSASRCPAIINLESRYFVVKCPYDIHVRFERNLNGRPALRNMAGSQGAVRATHLSTVLTMWSGPRFTGQAAVGFRH